VYDNCSNNRLVGARFLFFRFVVVVADVIWLLAFCSSVDVTLLVSGLWLSFLSMFAFVVISLFLLCSGVLMVLLSFSSSLFGLVVLGVVLL